MVTEEKLTGRALNDEVAIKLMGWRTHAVSESVWHAEALHDSFHKESFRPSESLEAAKQVEDRIEQLGLELKYATALLEATGTQYQNSLPVMVWAVIRATPEERCLAALSVMEAKERHENLDS